jgi:hypothetical protein
VAGCIIKEEELSLQNTKYFQEQLQEMYLAYKKMTYSRLKDGIQSSIRSGF